MFFFFGGRLVEYQMNGLGVCCHWFGIIKSGLKGNVNLLLMYWPSWTRSFCQLGNCEKLLSFYVAPIFQNEGVSGVLHVYDCIQLLSISQIIIRVYVLVSCFVYASVFHSLACHTMIFTSYSVLLKYLFMNFYVFMRW